MQHVTVAAVSGNSLISDPFAFKFLVHSPNFAVALSKNGIIFNFNFNFTFFQTLYTTTDKRPPPSLLCLFWLVRLTLLAFFIFIVINIRPVVIIVHCYHKLLISRLSISSTHPLHTTYHIVQFTTSVPSPPITLPRLRAFVYYSSNKKQKAKKKRPDGGLSSERRVAHRVAKPLPYKDDSLRPSRGVQLEGINSRSRRPTNPRRNIAFKRARQRGRIHHRTHRHSQRTFTINPSNLFPDPHAGNHRILVK